MLLFTLALISLAPALERVIKDSLRHYRMEEVELIASEMVVWSTSCVLRCSSTTVPLSALFFTYRLPSTTLTLYLSCILQIFHHPFLSLCHPQIVQLPNPTKPLTPPNPLPANIAHPTASRATSSPPSTLSSSIPKPASIGF